MSAVSPDQTPVSSVRADRPRVHHLGWLLLLVGGAVVWIIGAVITAVTDDTILVPTLILVGSFLVPVTMVTFALTREGEDQLSEDMLILAFVLGGAVGVVVAAFVETYLLPTATGTFIMVGLIEELTKALIVAVIAARLVTRRPCDGMVFGATVGAGFAAFESAGYAFGTLIEHQDDHPILNILQTEALRAVLSPFGHITWTAIFGGSLFAAAAANGRLRVTWPLVGTTVGIVTLHALWDQSYGWAILLTKGFRGDGWTLTWPNTQDWVGLPTQSELLVFQVIYDGLLLLNAAVGTWWVVHNWRKYNARSETKMNPITKRPGQPVVVTQRTVS
jgi:RsiW-degrading membrane proteinase PrsW (M82 family)